MCNERRPVFLLLLRRFFSFFLFFFPSVRPVRAAGFEIGTRDDFSYSKSGGKEEEARRVRPAGAKSDKNFS